MERGLGGEVAGNLFRLRSLAANLFRGSSVPEKQSFILKKTILRQSKTVQYSGKNKICRQMLFSGIFLAKKAYGLYDACLIKHEKNKICCAKEKCKEWNGKNRMERIEWKEWNGKKYNGKKYNGKKYNGKKYNYSINDH